VECDLEPNGWRQGSLVSSSDISELLSDQSISAPDNVELVIISQSCDLSQSVDTEPMVEAIVATRVEQPSGNLTHNKNARLLNVTAQVATGRRDISRNMHIRLSAKDKVLIAKERFIGLKPSESKKMPRSDSMILAEWCAARYSRPAFPSAFNDALALADKNGKKRRQIAKRISIHTSGLYLEVVPDRDIHTNESYSVNLLAVLIPSAEKHRDDVVQHLESLKALLEAAGMNVVSAVRSEDEVSLTMLKSLRRFYYDDISYKEGHPLPIELGTS